MEHKKNIYIFIAIVAFCIILSADIYNTTKFHRFRRLCDKYREQLIATEEYNRELADRIGRIAEITGRITEAADANITNARDIIETVEILRSQIKELEDCLGSSDSIDSYYNYWDNEFYNEGLME